jgi:hypothetical protein
VKHIFKKFLLISSSELKLKFHSFARVFQVTAENTVENYDKSTVFSYGTDINKTKYVPPPKPPNMVLKV